MQVSATVNSIHDRLYLVRRVRPMATMAATICSRTEMIRRISKTMTAAFRPEGSGPVKIQNSREAEHAGAGFLLRQRRAGEKPEGTGLAAAIRTGDRMRDAPVSGRISRTGLRQGRPRAPYSAPRTSEAEE